MLSAHPDQLFDMALQYQAELRHEFEQLARAKADTDGGPSMGTRLSHLVAAFITRLDPGPENAPRPRLSEYPNV